MLDAEQRRILLMATTCGTIFVMLGCSKLIVPTVDTRAWNKSFGGWKFAVRMPEFVSVKDVSKVEDFSLYEFRDISSNHVLLTIYSGNNPDKRAFNGNPAVRHKVNLNGAHGQEKIWLSINNLHSRELLIGVDWFGFRYLDIYYNELPNESKALADSLISTVHAN